MPKTKTFKMQQSLSLYATENFSFSNVSSSTAQCEYKEICNQIQPCHHSYQVYGKGIKRGITDDDLVINCSKRFKEYNTFFNFEELSKELDEIEFDSSDYFASQSSEAMKVTADSFAHSIKISALTECLCDKSLEFDLVDNKAPNACSTMLNGTDLEILNISSCSLSSPRKRRNTL